MLFEDKAVEERKKNGAEKDRDGEEFEASSDGEDNTTEREITGTSMSAYRGSRSQILERN